ncbi:BZ3500_MvSof-1268-A1-R1_Chr2-2g04931 [Microbotryum saponariae]|uniref:BZ3500_MvSof-1268-A1-R1_Chr2-2g04931 protein n=1 Tax=Microbotryum saponariae TaxID=289078 RepID=A0A2X0L1S1_9BASI|nr:BZ3500_MvSof-1268-A1-R1_Chr2-2g04931 [Microbotryum saponariae]SDA00504.1 BZ3501_MvSof-1269-A2-R1_Chr2-2g04605 [Microbotryum saponariae]
MCTVSQPVHIMVRPACTASVVSDHACAASPLFAFAAKLLPLFAAPAPACSTHARAPPPHTPELCQSTSPVLTEPLPPPRHRQLAITALMFHRPSRASPMHDARSQPLDLSPRTAPLANTRPW